MDIKYLGHSSFFIKAKQGRLVTDPFDPKVVGLKFPTQEADVVTVSHGHGDHNFLDKVNGQPLIVDWPGHFEKKGIRISGYRSWHDKQKGSERGDNILYRIEDDISILHCGDLGFVPEEEFFEEMGEVDVLMVPVGGFYTINADEAVEVVKRVEPSIVIPMHYSVPGSIIPELAPVADFLKKMGAEGIVPVPKLTVKREELGEDMKVVVMEITA